MFLSDLTIKDLIKKDKITIEPPVELKNVRSAGLRIHLGKEILIYEDGQVVDPQSSDSVQYKTIDLEKKPFIIEPGQFVIGHSYEKIKTPRNIIGFLDGRSTIARLGLTTHITAAIIDGMYEEPRTITLEIKNVGNLSLKLSCQMAIGLLLFAQLDKEVEQEVQTQYKNQSGLTPPNLKTQYK